MSRSKILLALLVLLALVGAACSSSDDDPESTATDQSESDSDESDDDDASSAADGSDDDTDESTTDEPDTDEAREASDIGVTEDTIRIGVLSADLDPLREIGFPLPEALTTAYLVANIGHYVDRWNADGGINGRMVEVVPLTWDPLDTATMENACVQGTLDQELFMVVNASGFNTSFIDCFTVDSDMFFLFGETASQAQIDRAPNRLFTGNPPAEVAGAAGTQIAIDQGIIAPGDTIGILSSNAPGATAGAEAATALLEAAGHDVVVVEVNTQSNDNTAMNAESAAAVSQFSADGVDHALVLLGFTTAAGFWNEVGEVQPDWDRTIIDAASATCTPFGASRTSPAADGARCLTAWGTYTSDDQAGVRADDAFEAECRATFIADYPDEFSGNSDPGVPAGNIIETADGETLTSDYAYSPCTFSHILREALTEAGINPTRDSLAAAMREISGQSAFHSNGEGTFGPDKNYFATQMHAVRFTIVAEDEPRGADGTFAGCPAPTNCWVAVSDEWIEVG